MDARRINRGNEFHNSGKTNKNAVQSAEMGRKITRHNMGSRRALDGEYQTGTMVSGSTSPLRHGLGQGRRPTAYWRAESFARQGFGQNLGTGFVPRDRIHGKVHTRQAGISDVADKALIRRKSGGYPWLSSKHTPRVGAHGRPVNRMSSFWMKSRTRTRQARDIFEECQTQFSFSGILMAGLTPLLGETDLVRHFMYPKSTG